MEIIFNNVSYIEKKASVKEQVLLQDLNLRIADGEIIGILGTNLSIIGNLLMILKRPSRGEIQIDNVVIKRTSHLENVRNIKNNVGFVYDDNKYFFSNNTVLEEIKEAMNNYEHDVKNVIKHISDALRIVGLSEDYLDKDPNFLSYTEQKKVLLASAMSYNPKIIILENFEKGLNFKERKYYRKLFLKLKNKFQKTIILLSTDISFMFNVVDKFYVMNKGSLVYSGTKENYYDNEIYKYIKMPKIVEFTKYVKSCGHDILEYTDIKELIKELYRSC